MQVAEDFIGREVKLRGATLKGIVTNYETTLGNSGNTMIFTVKWNDGKTWQIGREELRFIT